MPSSCILAHRGLWDRCKDRNSREALRLALSCGFGMETDVRDLQSELVISHDPPSRSAPRLSELLEEYRRLNAPGILALNIKSDGLASEIGRLMQEYSIDRYFVFDMSVPDMLRYHQLGMPFFSRLSDIESEVIGAYQGQGVWLDCFQSDWFGSEEILDLLSAGKQVAIVSPELHGRDHRAVWRLLRRIEGAQGRLLCCTDHPVELREWMS